MAPTKEGTEKVGKGIKANAIAVAALKEAFPEEWAKMHGDARESMGLSRETGRPSSDPKKRLQARIDRLQGELDALNAAEETEESGS